MPSTTRTRKITYGGPSDFVELTSGEASERRSGVKQTRKNTHILGRGTSRSCPHTRQRSLTQFRQPCVSMQPPTLKRAAPPFSTFSRRPALFCRLRYQPGSPALKGVRTGQDKGRSVWSHEKSDRSPSPESMQRTSRRVENARHAPDTTPLKSFPSPPAFFSISSALAWRSYFAFVAARAVRIRAYASVTERFVRKQHRWSALSLLHCNALLSCAVTRSGCRTFTSRLVLTRDEGSCANMS